MSAEIESREQAESELVGVVINAGKRARSAMDSYASDRNRVQLAAEVEALQLLVESLDDVSRTMFATSLGFRVSDSLRRLTDWLRMAESELRGPRPEANFP